MFVHNLLGNNSTGTHSAVDLVGGLCKIQNHLSVVINRNRQKTQSLKKNSIKFQYN